MGLVSWVVGFPLAPVKGVIALGRVIQRRAEEEMRHPASARRQLEEVEEARAAGALSAAEEADAQERVVESLINPSAPAPADEQESADEG